MSDDYQVRGGVGAVPGTVGPASVDGRAEWVPAARPGADLVERLEARLGSDVDLHRIVLGVLAPLCPALDGAPLGALVARLPLFLARELADPGFALATRVRAPRDTGDYVLEVSRLILHPPVRAVPYIRAVFAAARAVLSRGDAEAIAARLPGDVAGLWRDAR
jgi:uncharacterized protein (DUF2267 family)